MGFMDRFLKLNIGRIIKYLNLEEWYNTLSVNEQQKLKDYSGESDNLISGNISSSSQTQMGFFSGVANNAIFHKDYKYAIQSAQFGLTMRGDLSDAHFLYNALITAHENLDDFTNAKRYCMQELKLFPQMSDALKGKFNKSLPPSIPCRDTLLEILIEHEKNYNEATKYLKIFVEKELLTQEQARSKFIELKKNLFYDEAEKLLNQNQFEKAKSIFKKIIEIDKSEAALICKILGEYLLKNNNETGALKYFEKAISLDPQISGVKRKAQQLAKKVGVKLEIKDEDLLTALRGKEKQATEWWAKRDLANEFAKINQFDYALKLFKAVIDISRKQRRPCDTIYPHMAKMFTKMKNHREALLHYLLAYIELLNLGSHEPDPPKYLSEGIDKSLKKLDVVGVNHKDLYDFARTERNPERIVNRILKP